MNYRLIKFHGFALIFLALAGCKIQIDVPVGGKVTTESGSYECHSGQVCSINVYDLYFDETFIAVPDQSLTFTGWKKMDKGLCGGNEKPCHLSTNAFLDNDALMAILESSTAYHLVPVFGGKKPDSDGDAIPDSEDEYPHGMLTVGWSHSCAISVSGVRCWGSNRYGQTQVPKLRNPRQVSAGDFHTCALHDLGVKCWGNNDYGNLNVPAGLVNPIQVSAGSTHTCAIDDSGVHCWGGGVFNDRDAILDVPVDLVNPLQVDVASGRTCVLDDNGVHCWGDWSAENSGITNVPDDLLNPRQLLVDVPACVLDDTGVRCWGYIGPPWNDLVNPRQISGHGPCAIDNVGLICKGDSVYRMSANNQDLREVRSYRHLCVLVDSSVECMGGRNVSGETEVPVDLVIPE